MSAALLFFIAVFPTRITLEYGQALEFARSEYTLSVDEELSPANRYKEFRVINTVDYLSDYSTEDAMDHLRLNEGWFVIETSPGQPLSARPMRRNKEAAGILTKCFRQAGIIGTAMDDVLPKYFAQGARGTVIVFQVDRLQRPVKGLTQEMLLNELRTFGEGFVWVHGDKCAAFGGDPRPIDPETESYSRALWDVFDFAGSTYLIFHTVSYEGEELEVFLVAGARIRRIGAIEVRGK